MKRFHGLLWMAILLVFACDHGLDPAAYEPQEKVTGISGTITFQNWPTADSLHNLRLVAFHNFPPENIINEILAVEAYAYPAIYDTTHLDYYVDSLEYEFSLPAGQYEYICVAQQYGPFLYTDWRAVGQYDIDVTDPDPSAVEVIQDSVIANINIRVDFQDLPVQPF